MPTSDELLHRQNELLDRMDKVISTYESHSEAHSEEHQWVKLAIKKEAQSIAVRQAIIEKSLASLVWAGMCFIGLLIWNYIQNPASHKG
jgi:hypothetical protein